MTPREIYLLVVQTKAIIYDIRFSRDLAGQLIAEAAQHQLDDEISLGVAANLGEQFVTRNYEGSWRKG